MHVRVRLRLAKGHVRVRKKSVCACMFSFALMRSANLCPITERPACLSRKARRGSAEMSGCYRDSPTDASTEKYHVVKERRGGRGVGVGVDVSPGMDRRWNGREGDGE